MDILLRMRVILWLMVLSLWGVMIYQFLEEEEPDLTQMKAITRKLIPVEEIPDIDSPRIPYDQLFPAKPEEDLTSQPAATIVGAKTGAKLARIPAAPGPTSRMPQASPLPKPPPTARGPYRRPARRKRTRAKPKRPQSQEPATPKGFVKLQTPHFNVYSEGRKPSLEFLETLANLHANIMLDLAAFAPWARDERVSIFLFRTQESYRKVTGRPSWSGGASSVKRRKIYLYESDELVGILAHELCHIYFDSFFLGGRSNPLWLSEGMATLVQTERGLAAPNWLSPNMEIIREGGGYSLQQLVKVSETTGASDDEIRLWYSQSYSVVRFLIRSQYRSSFYKFCRYLRDGKPLAEALYRGYGMPFNRVKALEYAWRYDMQARKNQY
jgi:hypothetical protein